MSGVAAGGIIIGIKIEGFGKTSALASLGASGAQWRFATGRPSASVDTQGLYKDWIAQESLPSITESVDYRSGRFVIADAAFSLLQEVSDPDLDPRVLLKTIHQTRGTLGASITDSDTTVTLVGSSALITGLDGLEISVGRERIKLGTEGATGVYTSCTRGIHGTTAKAVTITDARQAVDVYRDVYPKERRLVTLFYLPEGAAALSEEVTIWQGVLHTTGAGNPVSQEIRCKGITGLLNDTKILHDPIRLVVTRRVEFPGFVTDFARLDAFPQWVEFAPGTAWGSDSLRLPASLGSSPTVGDPIWVMFKGTGYQLEYIGGTGSNARFRLPDLRVPIYTDKAVKLEDVGEGDEATEFYAIDAGAPGPGPTGTSLPLGGTDGDIITGILQVLTSTQGGGNGAYDVGIDFGFGIPIGMIDTASFDTVRARHGTSLRMPRTFFGATEKPESGLTKLEKELCHPNDLVFSASVGGLLSLESLHDRAEPGTTPVVIEDADLIGVVSYASAMERVVRRMQGSRRRTPEGKTLKVSFSDIRASSDSIGANRGDTFDGGGWPGEGQVFTALQRKLWRWADPVPLLSFETFLNLSARVGQLATVSCAHVFDVVDNVIVDGIDEGTVHIVAKSINLRKMTHEYTALYTGQRLGLLGEIGPSAKVVSYDAPSKTITVTQNYFVPAVGGLYDGDTDAFAALDALQVVDQYGTSTKTGLILASKTATTMVLTTDPTPAPSSGDIVRADSWDSMVQAQQAKIITVADTNGGLGSGPDAPFEYEG